MSRKKDRIGQQPPTYLYCDSRIEVLPYFLYEVCIYKYWGWGSCLLGSKFFRTSKPLNIDHFNKSKKYDGYSIDKEISLVGAPYEFIEENKLPMYKPNIKPKKLKKK